MSHLKIQRIIAGLMLIAGLFFFSSCFKRGCTDSNGENYEPGAKKECGCCYYYGKAFLMRNNSFGIEGLAFYVNGTKVKEVNGSIGYASAPDQRFYGVYTSERDARLIELDLGTNKEEEFDILVLDGGGAVLYSGRTKVIANHFTLLQ
jgi:hypothetical protein